MENELVSVIMPMYNSEKYIAQAIDSVRNQTCTNWEIIVMDDLSTDRSAEIVKEYTHRDGRIRYYQENEKSGVAKARNDAMRQARGRYLAFLDSDDMWMPEKLERQLRLMKEKNAAFVYSGCEVVDENGNDTGKTRKVPERIDYRKLLHGNVIPCLTVIVDKTAFNKIEMPCIGHEDYASWMELISECKVADGINEPLALYRVHNKSVSHNKIQTIAWTWRIFRKERKCNRIESAFYTSCHLVKAILKYLN